MDPDVEKRRIKMTAHAKYIMWTSQSISTVCFAQFVEFFDINQLDRVLFFPITEPFCKNYRTAEVRKIGLPNRGYFFISK